MNEGKEIGFSTQFRECKKAGFVGRGEFLSFEDHPEMLPAFPSAEMAKAIRLGEWKGIQTLSCLRFGGTCQSSNQGCRKLRGWPPFVEIK